MLVALAFLHHAGVREGADVGQDFQRAASLSDQKTSKLIMDFLGRPATGKDLRSAWGHDEVTTESGTGLIGWVCWASVRFIQLMISSGSHLM